MRHTSAIFLVIANLLLAIGVFSFNWNYHHLIAIYWFETIIIGLYNLFKIVVVCIFGEPFGPYVEARNKFANLFISFLAVGFFVAKFGLFVAGAGLLVVLIPGFLVSSADTASNAVHWKSLDEVITAISYFGPWLVLSHGVSFIINFIFRKDYQKVGVGKLIVSPYVRIAIMVVAIFLAVLVAASNPAFGISKTFALNLLIMKLVGDLLTHLWIHRRLDRITLEQFSEPKLS